MYRDFSSLAPHEEAHFVVFEQRAQEASKAASRIGLFGALGIGGLIMIIVLAFWGPVHAPGAPAGTAPAAGDAKPADGR